MKDTRTEVLGLLIQEYDEIKSELDSLICLTLAPGTPKHKQAENAGYRLRQKAYEIVEATRKALLLQEPAAQPAEPEGVERTLQSILDSASLNDEYPSIHRETTQRALALIRSLAKENATLRSQLVEREEEVGRLKETETAWLLEKPGRGGVCLGLSERKDKVRDGSLIVEFTTPAFALRFAREFDAIAFARVFMPGIALVPVEHEWSPPYNLDKQYAEHVARNQAALEEGCHISAGDPNENFDPRAARLEARADTPDTDQSDAPCEQEDGCPTELGRLQREWRSLSSELAHARRKIRALQSNIYANCPRQEEGWVSVEEAWLLGKPGGGLYVGLVERRDKIYDGSLLLDWVTPDRALRFAREFDAAAFARVFLPGVGVVASAHEWVPPYGLDREHAEWVARRQAALEEGCHISAGDPSRPFIPTPPKEEHEHESRTQNEL